MSVRPFRIPAILVVSVAVVLAVGLRIPKLTSRAFWYDEVFQVEMANASTLGELDERVRFNDRNPPTGHVLTRAGLAISNDELGARLPSFVFGMLCVPLGWAAARLWSDRMAALWVALVLAVSPAYVFYSREARVYAPGLAAVFGLFAATGWFRVRPNLRTGAVFALAAAFAASLQYAGIIVTALWLLTVWLAAPLGPKRSAFRTGWLVAAGLAAVIAAVWIIGYMLPQLRLRGGGATDLEFIPYFWDIRTPGSFFGFLTHAMPDFVQYPFLGGDTGPRWLLLALVAALPAAVAVVAAARTRDSRLRTLVVFNVASITAFIALAGLGKHPFGGTRHCLPLTAGLLLLVGIGLSRVGRFSRPLAIAWGGLALALMGYGMIHTAAHKHEHSVKEVAAAVSERARTGEPVIIVGGGVNSFKYYEPQLHWPGPVAYCGSYLYDPPECEFEPTLGERLRTHGRVWVIEFTPYDPSVRQSLEAVASKTDEVGGMRVRATLWSAKPGGGR